MHLSESQYLDLVVMISDLKDEISEMKGLVQERVILDKKKTLTISEAAEKTGKSYETIRRLVKKGKLEIKEGSSPIKITVRSLNSLD